MKILIVDDSSTARMFLEKTLNMVLETQNIHVDIIQAENGEDALIKLNTNLVGLIISDVNMPVMNGFTFLRNLKDSKRFINIPVVFISSMANEAREQNLIELGANYVLKKPITPPKIFPVINEFVLMNNKKENTGWGT